MTELQGHRGPDGAGFWTDAAAEVHLGHARLAIIDLSEAAAQPMLTAEGRYVIVYNGEIYNYKEVRAELAQTGVVFRTSSDTEVLLASYVQWGRDCLRRLNGMFAFAIWDRQERRLFLARDRWGIKPLYFLKQGGGLAFASELKALLTLPVAKVEIDESAVRDFLLAAHVDHRPGQTFFKDITQVSPGAWLEWRDGETREGRWYQLKPGAEHKLTPERIEEGRALLADAVRLHLRSDVEVGGTLSGGLDSSTLTCIVDQEFAAGWNRPYHVFIAHYPGEPYDEANFAQAVVRHSHYVQAHWLEPRADELQDDLSKLFWHQEEPFGDTSIYAHFRLMRLARAVGIKVLLTGQAGDEVFVGYPSFFRSYLGGLLRHGALLRLAHEVSGRRARVGESLSSLTLAALYHALPTPMRRNQQRRRLRWLHPWVAPRLMQLDWAAEPKRNGHSHLDAYLLEALDRYSLPHLLHHDDRNSMCFGIESRVPFLDHRLVEFTFDLHPDERIGQALTKQALRTLAAKWLPPAIQTRPDKLGFHSPLGPWLRANAALVRESTEPLIAEGRFVSPEIFRARREAFLAGDTRVPPQVVWRAVAVGLWQQLFLREINRRKCASSS